MSYLSILKRGIGCRYIMSTNDFRIYESPWIETIFYFVVTWYDIVILDTKIIYSCNWFDSEIGCIKGEGIYVRVWNKPNIATVSGIIIVGWFKY